MRAAAIVFAAHLALALAPEPAVASLCAELSDPETLAEADATAKAHVQVTNSPKMADHLAEVFAIADAQDCGGIIVLRYSFRPNLDQDWVGGEPIFVIGVSGEVAYHHWPD